MPHDDPIFIGYYIEAAKKNMKANDAAVGVISLFPWLVGWLTSTKILDRIGFDGRENE